MSTSSTSSTSNPVPGMSPTPAAARAGGENSPDVAVAPSRVRQTTRAASPFREVLAGGVGVLVRGATVATSVVAGPVMAAAVREAGAGATGALASSSPARAGGSGSGVALASSGVPAGVAGPGGDQSDMGMMQSMQRESQTFNLQLLELQENVQQENRRFTTISNVLRAKHDTAKAAVSNIRS